MAKNMYFFSPKLTASEKRLWAMVTIALLVITTLPLAYAWLVAPKDYAYIGFGSLAPGDTSLYFSYFEQVKQGHALFKDLYTGELQARTLFIPFFLFWGMVGKLLHLNNPLLYQVARIVHLVVFMVVASRLCAIFFTEERKRKVALFFFAFASGWGVYFAPFLQNTTVEMRGYYHWPMDLWVVESNTFLTLYHNPLYIFSLTLLLGVFLCYMYALQTGKSRWIWVGGITTLVLVQTHPYHMPTLAAVVGLFLLARAWQQKKLEWRVWKPVLGMALLALPAALYWLWLLRYDWLLASRITQQGGYVPVWWLTLVSYGLLTPLAIFALARRRARYNESRLFFFSWLAAGAVLIHLKFLHHPRRLTEGLQIPLVFFAVDGLFLFAVILRQRLKNPLWQKLFVMRPVRWLAFLLFFGMSQLYVLANDIALAQNTDQRLYYPKEDFSAMTWLRENTPETAVILSTPDYGNILPGRTGRTVFIGHTSETARVDEKYAQTVWWYAQETAAQDTYDFLKKNNISHVWYGAAEKDMRGWNPATLPQLKPVFANSRITLFEVL